jgi:hypothetical protein
LLLLLLPLSWCFARLIPCFTLYLLLVLWLRMLRLVLRLVLWLLLLLRGSIFELTRVIVLPSGVVLAMADEI